ncbi:MAG: hypothetical protein JXA19_01320 [Anaerolineales bacterium]|nr:hypothetical protein [Anaerolineales bacterium]
MIINSEIKEECPSGHSDIEKVLSKKPFYHSSLGGGKSQFLHNEQPIKANGRIVGNVVGNIYHKTVSSGKHFLRKPPAIALNISEIEQAEKANAEIIEVTDRDTDLVYSSTLEYLKNKGVEFNRGWGDQIFLPLGDWKVNRKAYPTNAQMPFLGRAV